MKYRYAGIMAMAICCYVLADAQKLIIPNSQFILNFDYARFRNSDTSGYVEFYYAFYPRLISYQKCDTQYCGAVIAEAIIRKKMTGEIVVNARTSIPLRIRDTSDVSMSYKFVNQAGYVLPFGDYQVSVIARDSLVPDRCDSLNLPIDVKAFPPTEICSDIELCSAVKASTAKGDPYYKNSLEVVPNPTLVFGVASHPMLFYYLELYNLNPTKDYEVRAQVLNLEGAVLKETAKTHRYAASNVVEAGNIHVTSIYSGKYRICIVIRDTSGAEVARSQKTFFLYNPHIKQPQFAASSIKAREFAGLTADELEAEFRKAQYVASDEQIKTFSHITSAEGRREFLARFWSDVEAGRSTASMGILRSEYLARLQVADERFRLLTRAGWKTDRGRVYVLYGEPDEIQRYPSSQNTKPYETWLYRQLENGVEFDFIDRTGFGDYVLVNSTKRGEIQDDQWGRQLQLR